MTHRLTPAEARRFLVAYHGLRATSAAHGIAALPGLLGRLRCLQIDPLDAIGPHVDLVAVARIDGLRRGDVWRALLGQDRGIEHYAKEHCLLPAERFASYRAQAQRTPHWRQSARMRDLPRALLDGVLAEVEAHGPQSARSLSDHGVVGRMGDGAWAGTGKAGTLALRTLWLRCELAVSGRLPDGQRLFDLPARVLPRHAAADAPAAVDAEGFQIEGLLDRVAACGLMPRATGPWWGVLQAAQRSDLPERLVAEGRLAAVTVDGSRRSYLAPPDFRDQPTPDDDGRVRILGPLDPLLWSRPLVKHAFDFDYVWEVYKPPEVRRWGWYVVPLLQGGRLVARMEARLVAGELAVAQVWPEPGQALDPEAFRAACERHAACLGERAG